MARKPKKTQPERFTPRDLFQTPNYATDLLIPFIPDDIDTIWEPANGEGKISDRLKYYGYDVHMTDIRMEDTPYIRHKLDFLKDKEPGFLFFLKPIIITNPPFSLKDKFFKRCLELKYPFALLLPFDMSQWLIKYLRDYDIRIVLPLRRIDYITPTGKSGLTGHTAQYHSAWFTYKFNVPKQITVVNLSLAEKRENV